MVMSVFTPNMSFLNCPSPGLRHPSSLFGSLHARFPFSSRQLCQRTAPPPSVPAPSGSRPFGGESGCKDKPFPTQLPNISTTFFKVFSRQDGNTLDVTVVEKNFFSAGNAETGADTAHEAPPDGRKPGKRHAIPRGVPRALLWRSGCAQGIGSSRVRASFASKSPNPAVEKRS